jgi:hypothetical protein
MHFEVRKNKEIRAQTAVIMQMRVDIMRPIRESEHRPRVETVSLFNILCACGLFFDRISARSGSRAIMKN